VTDNFNVVIEDLVNIDLTIINDPPISITVDALDETQISISDVGSDVVVQVLQEIVNIEVQPEGSPKTIEVSTPVAGPQGPQGPPANSLTFFEKKLDSINASSSKVIDTIPLIDFKLIEYTFRASNSPNNKTKGLKMIVTKTDSSINDQVFAKIGDAISFNLNTQINGTDMNLILQNNETFALDLALIRAML
jgi:hypothetical protein